MYSCHKKGGGGPLVERELNVSITALVWALQQGCEPEQAMHVYLAALTTE